ncbi:MAG: transcriptional repressor LexA [Treponemataceae bacterium]
MKALTKRQLEFFCYIRDFSKENEGSPTIREIALHFKTSLKTVQDHISALIKKGYLSSDKRRSRSLRILNDIDDTNNKIFSVQSSSEQDPSIPFVSIPLLGSVVAGMPLFTEEHFEKAIHLPITLVKNHASYFALKVHGDSMINAGIFTGDLAIIEQSQTAVNGDIVVASLDDAITLKRFFKEATRVRLESENDAYKPIFCQEVRIVGKLKTIIRSY